jgi:hypothetical protein
VETKNLVTALQWMRTLMFFGGFGAFMAVSFNFPWWLNLLALFFAVVTSKNLRRNLEKKELMWALKEPVVEQVGKGLVVIGLIVGAWSVWLPEHQGRVAQATIVGIIILFSIAYADYPQTNPA